MNQLNRVWITGVAWLVALTVCQASSQARLELRLSDGSRIVGASGISRLPVQTAVGRIDVGWDRLSSLTREDRSKRYTLRFRNGDVLRADVLAHSLPMDCSFGRIKVAFALIDSISVVSSDLARDRLLHFSFDTDEGGFVRNEMDEGLRAVVHSARWVEEGISGGAMRFKGGKLEVPADRRLDFGTRDFSWSVWFKAERLGATQQLVDHNYNPEIQIEPDGLVTAFIAFRFCGRMHSREPIAPRAWHFVVVTRKEGVARLYVNGLEEASSDASQCNASSPSALTIGNNHDGNEPFQGLIDEFSIWRRSLSADEVRQLYDAQRPPQ